MAYKHWAFPAQIERQYSALLRGYVDEFTKDTLDTLKRAEALRLDDWSSDLTAILLELATRALRVGETNILRLPEVFASINKFNDRQWRLVVKAGTGLDLPESGTLPMGARAFGNVSAPDKLRARFGVGFDLYREEPWLVPRMNNWLAENTSLIKSIPTQYMTQVESIIRVGVMNGTSPKAIADEIRERSGVSKRRAHIIARDQVTKANAMLTEHRQTELGVTKYKWVTAHDERVRGNPYGRYPKAVPSHYARDGKMFDWNQPPEGGHPGMAILCRCHAQPDFETIEALEI
jgi:SPP1 gp7 family putative phage head morphogenesis protein